MELICDDLVAEHDVARAHGRRTRPRPVGHADARPGWAVRDQISHLWFFDQRALMALTDPDAFAADAAATDGRRWHRGLGRARPRDERRRDARRVAHRSTRAASTALARVDPSARVPWYGPAMAARSFITARLMETWAHGQDVVDALGVAARPTDRLRHVAHIGVRARPFSYAINGDDDARRRRARRARAGPTATTWDVGRARRRLGARRRARLLPGGHPAPARGRHRARRRGRCARGEWIGIAQAFAGAPGTGRRAGQFR